MNVKDFIDRYEIEITNNCNAACPSCQRTDMIEAGTMPALNDISISEFKNIFSKEDYVKGKVIKFCGTKGDPIVNNDFMLMCEYICELGGSVVVSTNGAYNTGLWWDELGAMSKKFDGAIHMHFCIDGHKETNHIYRVNTVWNVLERNITAYSKAGGHGKWIYIKFDHNMHEFDIAKQHAKDLGFSFAERTGARNIFKNKTVLGKQKLAPKQFKEVEIKTTHKDNQHSNKHKIESLLDALRNKEHVSLDKKSQIQKSINCKYLHYREVYIGSDYKVWPCCYLADPIKTKESFFDDRQNIFHHNWNDIRHYDLETILNHPWYTELLEDSWNMDHPDHIYLCTLKCGDNAAWKNKIVEVNE